MEQSILKVTVAGLTGAIGPALLSALHNAGLQVQGLTRRSKHPPPFFLFAPGIKILQIDYLQAEELDVALQGQDVVISTLGDSVGAVVAQEALLEACLRTGVRRLIPSEFGSDTLRARVRKMPFFAAKVRHQDLLRSAVEKKDGFSFCIVITGPFLDWGLSVVPFILNFGSRNGQVFDGGETPFSTTRLSTLCTAVLAILRNLDETANRTVHIHDAIITQNQLIARFQALYPALDSSSTFTSTPICTKQLETDAWLAYKDPSSNPLDWVLPFINISIWSNERLCMFEEVDNDLLGLPVIEDSELDDVLNDEIVKAVAGFEVQVSENGESQVGGELLETKSRQMASAGEKALENAKL